MGTTVAVTDGIALDRQRVARAGAGVVPAVGKNHPKSTATTATTDSATRIGVTDGAEGVAGAAHTPAYRVAADVQRVAIAGAVPPLSRAARKYDTESAATPPAAAAVGCASPRSPHVCAGQNVVESVVASALTVSHYVAANGNRIIVATAGLETRSIRKHHSESSSSSSATTGTGLSGDKGVVDSAGAPTDGIVVDSDRVAVATCNVTICAICKHNAEAATAAATASAAAAGGKTTDRERVI